eukprot:1043439-Pelagomonas_calceolata.AAC.1
MSGKAQLNQRSDGVIIIDSSCHTQKDGVQGCLIVSVWVSEATGADSGNGSLAFYRVKLAGLHEAITLAPTGLASELQGLLARKTMLEN